MNFDDGFVLGMAVGGKTGEKTIVKNGEYNAADDDLTGYHKVIAELPLDKKDIIKNGTYYARDDGLEGYDVINVNVKVKYDDGDGEVEIDPGDDVVTPEGVKGDKWIWKFSVVPYDANDPDSYQYVLCTRISTEDPTYISRSNFWIDGNVNRSYNVRIISAVKVEGGYEVTATGQDKNGNVYTSTTVFTS